MIDTASVVSRVPTGLWVGGTSVRAAHEATFPVEDPATGQTIAVVASAGASDALTAMDDAHDAQAEWAAVSPRRRSTVLRSAWQIVCDRAEELALLITAEMGKTVPESRAEVTYAAEFLRWYSEEAVRINGRYTQAPGGAGRILVTKTAVGPCLAITPWNFPLAMVTRKIGPALAAGCTVILKPAAETPLTALAFAEILAQAGLPPGVVSVLPTIDPEQVAGPLMQDPRLRKVTFTGSTATGRILLAHAAGNILRTSMELGGNAPFIVCDDADIDAAIEGAMAAKMRNAGEACTAANRFIVAEPIREEFTARLAARIAALRVGPGYETGVDVGALVSSRHRDKVAALVDGALRSGARLRTGGHTLAGPGHYYQPTLLDNVAADAAILREEIFGPVAVIIGFSSVEEALERANNTEYGLAAYVYTRDLDRAWRISEALDFGMVGVNRGIISDAAAPFGGIKQSGMGTEGGAEGIEEYLETKYVAFTR
ncbi:NAD-dependent succinate-semialdehyde dehydrogenase [Nocardia nova]|uniref:NAD-dependent succinate-semialdehyde dehydrogenase n=1 Tax=Nocardia nova TaxID=37330 RepID=UPI00371787C9